MKTGYVYHRDAASPDIQSGRPQAILREFQRAGWMVEECFPLPRLVTTQDRVHRYLTRWLGRRYLLNRTRRHLRWTARYVEQKLDSLDCDFIFSPGSTPLAYMRTDRPVTFSSDATLRSMVGYYREYCGIAASSLREYEAAERDSLHRANLLVYSSQWAADSAVKDYGVPAERVAVIPSGANIGADNQADEIALLIRNRLSRPLELLFVGRAWERKGGPLCLETTKILNQRGLPTVLHIVGCQPVIAASEEGMIRRHGRLRISVAAERAALEKLFRASHLLFVPSRAEAFGMVFCEASAFGLPSVSTATGGIPTVIQSGVNGELLPLHATPVEYADTIAALWVNRDHYADIAHQSFGEFRRRLNWRAWMDAFLSRVEPLVQHSASGASRRHTHLKRSGIGPQGSD